MHIGVSAQTAMLAAIPRLRAFAVSLCRNREQADDLVQETLLRACLNIDRFEPGTSMPAWLTTILRNEFYSNFRRRRREVEDIDGVYADTLVIEPTQMTHVSCREVNNALADLPAEMREALLLVGPCGYSYDEAAGICGCAAGTIKSRVHRARACLAKALSIDNLDDFIANPTLSSVGVPAERSRMN
jgi:RNA polymerase sigma-70 factor, ECF subfamily